MVDKKVELPTYRREVTLPEDIKSPKQDIRRGPPPVRGVFVYVMPDGQIGHQFRGEPPLNEAELLGLGQYLTQLFALTSLENIQVGLGLTLKKIEELVQKPEEENRKDDAIDKADGIDMTVDRLVKD